MKANNYLQLIEGYRSRHNFNKLLPKITKAQLILQFGRQYDNPILKTRLKACDNFNQIINVIEQQTKELSKLRTDQEINDFKIIVERIIKFARL